MSFTYGIDYLYNLSCHEILGGFYLDLPESERRIIAALAVIGIDFRISAVAEVFSDFLRGNGGIICRRRIGAALSYGILIIVGCCAVRVLYQPASFVGELSAYVASHGRIVGYAQRLSGISVYEALSERKLESRIFCGIERTALFIVIHAVYLIVLNAACGHIRRDING